MLSDVQCILNVPPSWSFLNGLLNHVVKELNVEEALKSSILVVQKAVAVPLSWYFLNGLLNHVIKELNVEEVLKSPIFVVQKAAAPKNGVEFRQGSIGTIRSSIAMSFDVPRRRARFSNSWFFLNGLLNHVVKELNDEEVLKSSIFVVQKAAAPKNGVEFRQGSIGTIRSSLARSCDLARGLRISTNQRPENYLTPQTHTQTHRHTDT